MSKKSSVKNSSKSSSAKSAAKTPSAARPAAHPAARPVTRPAPRSAAGFTSSASAPLVAAFRKLPVWAWVLAVAAIVIVIGLAVSSFLPLDGTAQQDAAQVLPADITVTQAHEKYGQEGVFFLDVREQEEWDAYHIPETILIPLGQLAQRANEVPQDQEIVVVCRSGNRSQEGRDILKAAGFENVTSMSGGVNEWRSAGYPTEP